MVDFEPNILAEKIKLILENFNLRQDEDHEWVNEFIDELVLTQKKIVLTNWKTVIGSKKYEKLLEEFNKEKETYFAQESRKEKRSFSITHDLKNLLGIDCSNMIYTEKDVISLNKFLDADKSVTHLNLDDCDLTDDMLGRILETKNNHLSLKSIRLCNNHIECKMTG